MSSIARPIARSTVGVSKIGRRRPAWGWYDGQQTGPRPATPPPAAEREREDLATGRRGLRPGSKKAG